MGEQLCKEIHQLITLITSDLKLALDCLFDVIEEIEIHPFENAPNVNDKIQKARDLYHKHFVC